jgi:prepilin-type N-terminal cleavage/methylation domain-containing protein
VEKNLKIAGVSLIEVMISMVLISLLLMAVASVFPRMSSHRKAIQESDIAKDIATETLEYLQMITADPNNPSYGCSPGSSLPMWDNPIIDVQYKEREVGAAKYYIRWSQCSNSGSVGYYQVTDTVRWEKPKGKWHKVTVTGTVQ